MAFFVVNLIFFSIKLWFFLAVYFFFYMFSVLFILFPLFLFFLCHIIQSAEMIGIIKMSLEGICDLLIKMNTCSGRNLVIL